MPARWGEAGLADYRGLATFTRRFGYPGKIDETEHVWLTCDGCTGCHGVSLNGQALAVVPDSTFAFDVTKLLRSRNRLEIAIEGTTADAGLWGEVALEIRKDAFLADVRIEQTKPKLQIAGKVVGSSPQPLELYTLVDGRHVDYRTVLPSNDGTPFRIELSDVQDPAQLVRVELIHISTIWYIVEVPIR